MKIKDIHTGLNEEVDASTDFNLNNIKAANLNGNKKTRDTNDIKKNLPNINLVKSYFVKILKNNTSNFDGFTKGSKLKDINLQKRPSFLESIKKKGFHNKIKFISFKFMFRISFLKKLGIIFVLFSVFLFLDKIIVEQTINSGYKKIISIKDSSSLDDTILKINNARFDFIIGDVLFIPFLLIPNNDIRNGYHIIKGGKNLTKLGYNFLQIYTESKKFLDNKGLKNILLSQLLYNLKNDFINIEQGINATLFHYNQVKNIKNSDIESKFSKGVTKLTYFSEKLNLINNNYDSFLNIMGHNKEKKYLVIFQNSDEIRPTGGFMGSMGIVKIFKGKVTDFDKKDVYAYEWNLKSEEYQKLLAPKGINKLTKNFGLRDSNYYVDVAKSSGSIKYFIEKSGYKIDGIIYLNKNIVLDFLDVIGKIEMKNIADETVTSENFSRLMSILVEAKIFKKGTLGTPKQILFDFIEEFKLKILNNKDYFAYAKIIAKNIINRDIIFYSFSPEENNLLTELGVTGKIDYKNTLDFVYPVYTSLSGNKSDRYMKRTYEKQIKIEPDCSISTNLNIISKHTYDKTEENKLKDLMKRYNIRNTFETLYIQGAGENRQYTRVILPKEAIVEKSDNYEVNMTSDMLVIDFFQTTRKNEITNFNINYNLPNKECKKYDFMLYKQPGIRNYNVKIISNDNILQKNGIDSDFVYSTSN